MISGINLAEVAALIGDVARANILSALLGGKALTASELAWSAGVTPQTASGHLAKLLDGHLVAVEKQGRHRYYRLASAAVAQTLESVANLSMDGPKRHRPTGPKDAAMRHARTCYDHMAGRLAVALAERFEQDGYLHLGDGAGIVTDEGKRFFCDFGIDLEPDRKSTRPLCRCCLDWSERRMHIGGRLGAALLQRCIELGWLRNGPDSRTLAITRPGERGFRETMQIGPEDLMLPDPL
ncbi:ArsR/SmtB family transcription factor [Agrobacterium sp. ES01]|uniref:ArsR/SmtB family transcription factor n=1 Tax=Agrobacterium sp. ES01 TaxID=3420714 RepID=UPI003D11A603